MNEEIYSARASKVRGFVLSDLIIKTQDSVESRSIGVILGHSVRTPTIRSGGGRTQIYQERNSVSHVNRAKNEKNFFVNRRILTGH